MTSSRGCDLKYTEELQAGGFFHVAILLIAVTWGSLLPSYAKGAAEARATSRFGILLTDYSPDTTGMIMPGENSTISRLMKTGKSSWLMMPALWPS